MSRVAALWDEWVEEDPLGEAVPGPLGGQAPIGVPFLVDELGADARLAVLLGFGADVTLDPSGWPMTDVSSDVLQSAGVRIAPGRADEQSQSQPARAEFILKNRTGNYTPRRVTSIYFPNVHLGIPARVTVNTGSSGVLDRFTGFVDGIYPSWDTTGNYAVVKITAKGILNRLGQGQAPLRSALRRAIPGTNPIAYWSIEDGQTATQAASGLPGGPPLAVSAGTVRFGATTGPDGSDSLADFSSGGSLSGLVPRGTDVSWRIEFVTKFNTLGPAAFAAVLQWYTGGNVALWEIDAASLANGGLSLQYITGIGAAGGPFLSNVAVDDGKWHHIRVTADPSSGNIALVVYLDGVAVITQTIIGAFPNTISGVVVNPTGDATEEVPSLGHLTIWAPWSSTLDTYRAYLGWAGEGCWTRFLRLCSEEGVPAAIANGATSGGRAMGPQTVKSLVALLRECEAVDGGVMADG